MGRKGKAVPASSAKALEICGDTSKLGVSPADVFAQFGRPLSKADDATVSLEDVEVALALQALQKKDPTTRLRAVAELRELLLRPGAGPLGEVCAPFLHIYRRLWPQDNEPRVREGMQKCLQVLVENLQRDFAKHLRSAFPTWLCAMFDSHAEVTQASRGAFTAAFPTDEKRRGVFRHCQKDCLELLTSNLRHSEQSLHDELGLPPGGDRDTALQRQDRYARVLAASLSALGELVHVCTAPSEQGTRLGASQLLPFFEAGSPCAVWPRLSSKQPAPIRRAAVQCLMRICRAVGSSDESGLQVASATHRSAALNVMADEAVPPATAAAFVRDFAMAGQGSNCWEGMVASKSLWPRLTALLQRGAASAGRQETAADFLQHFCELLQVFPESAWAPGKAELLLAEILQSLAHPRGAFAAAGADAWQAYFSICSTAGVHVAPDWRWHPVVLYLGGRQLSAAPATEESASAPPQVTLPASVMSALPGALAAGLSEEAMHELVARLESAAEMLQVSAENESTSLKLWRAWTALAKTLQTAKVSGMEATLQRLITKQLRRLLLDVVRGTPSPKMLDALRGLLACDLGEGLDQKDAELIGAIGPAGEGLSEIPSSWRQEAKILAWPILPWMAALQQASGSSAALIGDQLLRPLLADLARHGNVPAELKAQLAEVFFPRRTDADAAAHARCLRLALECVPQEYGLAATERAHEVVQELLGLLLEAEDAGDASCGPAPLLDDAVAALTLAFRAPARGGLAAAETATCLRRLVSASKASEASRRLTLLVSKTLSEREEGELGEFTELVAPTSAALLQELLAAGEAGEADEAWLVLSRLLSRAGFEQTAGILSRGWPFGARGAKAGAAGWVHGLLQAAEGLERPALELLSSVRRALRGAGPAARLLPEGVVSAAELHENAVITGLVLRGMEETCPLSFLEDTGVLEVVWELLLAASLTAEASVVSGATQAWSLLQRSSDGTKLQFLDLALKEAASEGGAWRIETSKEGETLLPLSAHLAGLSPLRHLLAALWTDADRSESLGAEGFLAWALSDKAATGTLGWGHAAATVVRQSAGVGVIQGPELTAALGRCRAWIRDSPISGEAAITEQHLVFAAAVEEAAQAHTAEAPRTGEAERVLSDGPVIAEVPEETRQGITAKEKEPSPQEDLDTSLVESIEKLLRWSQAQPCRADTFAVYTAALWPAVSTADSTAGRLPSRMVRLALETLGTASVSARSCQKAPAAPGVWRLVAALCEAGQWPEANWPTVLQAVATSSKWLLNAHEDSTFAVSDAFVDDACAAAAALLPFAPRSLAPKLVPLLSAPDSQLRAAAGRRLQGHCWVPGDLGAGEQNQELRSEDDEKGGPWSAARALETFGALLEADSLPSEAASTPTAQGPSCGDVAYVVLGSVFGRELTDAVWAVEEALNGVATWETDGGSEEDSDEEGPTVPSAASVSSSHRSYGRRFRLAGTEQGSLEDPCADPATPASSSRGRRRAWLSTARQLPLPLDVEHACAASLAAWETLLRGIDKGLQEKGRHMQESCSHSATGTAKDGASPAELLAAVLQLTPDTLGTSATLREFPSQVAPASHWDMPLQPLLRLLCHLLTSSRLTGFSTEEEGHSPEATVAGALGEAGERQFDLLPLAARTLLLALRLAPGGARRFWEQLPRKRDQSLVERLISRNFSQQLIQAEASAANTQLEADRDRLEDIDASVIRRQRQLLLLLQREELRTELSINLPPSFPLRPAQAEFPEKMPGIPKPRVRNWMLQARQLLSGPRPMSVGKAVLMWSKSFALFFKGVEDCPICYNVIQLTTQTIPRKACPTCKHKFHNECLYQWFRSSNKTTCPLCNQPF